MSFWLPGQFGSFSAVPGSPGWSLGAVNYYTSGDAGRSKQFPRNGRIVAGLDVTADLLFLSPGYTFAGEVLGGQAALSMPVVFGRAKVEVSATLTGPNGGTVTGSEDDTRTGFGDLYPTFTLRWNRGVHNYMAYGMAGVPVGEYDQDRLANLGTNHWSLDAGGGYTYLDDKKGHEFSAVLGLTYNFENPDTDYRSGTDAHLDWGASQLLSETFHLGLGGYFYNQLTGDSGDGARLGDFESEVAAIGPQAGWFFKVGDNTWYFNLKGYYEFNAQHRPEGWNAWLTLSLPLGTASK